MAVGPRDCPVHVVDAKLRVLVLADGASAIDRLLLSIEVYLTTYTIGTFHLSFWSFGPTELRLLLCIGNIALFYRPVVRLAGHQFLLFDVGGAIGILGMAMMLVWSAVRHTVQLYNQEPLP